MHRRTKKDNFSNEDNGQNQNLKHGNKSNEKKSATGATEKTSINETKDERNIRENRHHKNKTEEKLKKHGISERQTPKGKKSERGNVEESVEKSKKTKHKDRSCARESVFANIENYLKSLSRTPRVQDRRSRSSEQYVVKHKNNHDLRREKTIHVERTKEHVLKMQQKKEARHEMESRKQTSHSKVDRRPKRNDGGNEQLFYCRLETNSPFQPAAREGSPPAHHSKRCKEKKSSPAHDEVHSKDITRKKLKEDNSETLNVEISRVNIHKRKKSRTNIVDEPKTLPIPMVESNIECKRRRSHKRKSNEFKSRSKRKNDTNASSRSHFQEKIEDDLKSYFMRIQNLIDTKLDKMLHANKSMIKIKAANKSHRSKDEKKSCKSSSRDKHTREEIRDADISRRHMSSRIEEKQERKPRRESKNQKAFETTKIEGDIDELIDAHARRKRDIPVRSSSSKCHHQGCRDEYSNSMVETKSMSKNQLNSSRSKKHDEPHCQTNKVDHPISQQGHSTVPSGSPKNEKQLREKRERKQKARVPEISAAEIADPTGGHGSFRVEGIEPPNLEGGRTLRNKKSRKLECKTVSIIGITSQIKGEYTKYTTGLEEALERKKKTKRFKLYYKYPVAGDNFHSSGDKSIVSEDLKLISDHSEDNPNVDAMKNELKHELPNDPDVLIHSKSPPKSTPVPEKLTKKMKTKGDQNCTSKNMERCHMSEANQEEHGPGFPEVQYKYFKGLRSSSSESSIESKKARVTEKRCNEEKPRDFCDFDYWGSEAKEHHNPMYFLPDPLIRYKNRNYQFNRKSKSDIQLSYSVVSTKDPTKISMSGDQNSSMEYPGRNNLLCDELNIYDTLSTPRKESPFPEQKAYHQQTKMSSDEYDARIEDLLNKSKNIQSHVPQGFGYFSNHCYPPVFFSTNICSEEKPVFHKRMNYWNETEQNTPVAANDNNHKTFVNKGVFCEPCTEEIKKKPVFHKNYEIEQKLYPDTPVEGNDENHKIFVNKEVFCEPCNGSKIQESDLTQKHDKFTFFSNENVFKTHKFATSMKEDPVDINTQKYETCDVGTAAEKTCVGDCSTKKIAVEAAEEISTNIQKIDKGVNVRKPIQTKALRQPDVAAEETNKIVQPKKRVKEKSVLTKKKSELIKPMSTPPKCRRQTSDVDKRTKGSETVDERAVGADKKTKVPTRKNKNNASDLKPKSNNICDTKICKPGKQNTNNCVVDETQIKSCVKNIRAESRSSKRSGAAQAVPVAKQKPRANESSWYRSLGGKFDKFNSLKRSQSEMSFRNVNLDTEESRITSLVCMHKFLNDIKCDVSSKSNTYSLDRYFGKLASSEAHNSSFFLTKDYKTADVSAYHKRKMYDEIIRRKMRKRGKVHNRSLAPQVFEVRFLTVDNFQTGPTQDVINRDCSSIKSSLQNLDAIDKVSLLSKNSLSGRHLISDFLHTPSEECLTKKMIETKILDLCKEMICNQSLFDSQSKFNSLGFISGCEFCASQPNFVNFVDCLRKSLIQPGSDVPMDKGYPCEIINIYDDHSNQKVSSDSSQIEPVKAVELNASEELLVDSSTLQKPSRVLTGRMSCPILKSQNSFQYLYQSESKEVTNHWVKRPIYTILGYTLKSDTNLHKHPVTVEHSCLESVRESSSVDESGYGSTRKNSSSFTNFFKRPEIAALLRPQSHTELCATPTHLTMMRKCQEYAQKVMAHSQSEVDVHEVYEEIPLDILLSRVNISNVKAFGSEPYVDLKKAQLQTYSESVVNQETPLPPFENLMSDLRDNAKLFDVRREDQQDGNEVSLIYENSKADHSKSFLCVALTPSPSIETVTSTTDSNVDKEFAHKILKSGFVISNINFSARRITLLESSVNGTEQISKDNAEFNYEGSNCTFNPIKLRRMVAKKFFENLLGVYEKENVFSSALIENDSFFENHLLPLIHLDENQKCKEKRPKSSVGNRMINFLARKMFKSKEPYSSSSPIIYTPTGTPKQATLIDEYCRENLRSLASRARKYFSMYVQAVRVNRKINDELKICGFQKLLENIEQGRVTFLKTSERVDFEDEITTQVKRAFCDMYLDACVEARKHHRELSSNDLKLLKVFVCNYRIGLLSHAELIASYIGRGYYKTETQLRGAVLYLLKNVDVNSAELEEYCEKCL